MKNKLLILLLVLLSSCGLRVTQTTDKVAGEWVIKTIVYDDIYAVEKWVDVISFSDSTLITERYEEACEIAKTINACKSTRIR